MSGSALGALLVTVSLVGVAGQLVQTRVEREGRWSPLDRSLALRTGAAVGAALCLAGPEPSVSRALGAALGAAVLVAMIAVEPFVARAARFAVPIAARLPGVRTRRSLPDLGVPAVATSLVATAAGLLLAAIGASAWWWPLLGVLAVAPIVAITLEGRAKIVAARRQRATVPQALAAYAPDFVVYTSRPDDASYQVLMWLPYLQRAGLRFIIVTRNAVPARALAGLTDVPVIEARGMGDVDGLVVPSLKAAFYVNASSGNGMLVRFQHLTHIYLGHGDSDKPPSYNPTHAMYDQIFAAGAAATRRYAAHGVHIAPEKFRIVGRPQVEGVRPAAGPIAEVARPTVLYAPTWRGHVEETMLYSLPGGEQIVSALLARGATVIFRPHPFSYDFPDDAATISRIQALLASDAERSGRGHLWGPAAESERGILDCINDSDAMVSDVSSVVSDYLFSGKPFAMIAVPSDPDSFVEEFPVARASYVVSGDFADLETQLDRMLGADPLAATRKAIRVDYLGDFPADDYAAAFVDSVRHVTGKTADDILEDRGDDIGEDRGDAAEDGEQTATEAGEEGRGAEDLTGKDEEESASGSSPQAPNWSAYTRFAMRVGLDLAGTGLALGALASALAHGPGWLTVALIVASAWAAFQSVSGTVLVPGPVAPTADRGRHHPHRPGDDAGRLRLRPVRPAHDACPDRGGRARRRCRAGAPDPYGVGGRAAGTPPARRSAGDRRADPARCTAVAGCAGHRRGGGAHLAGRSWLVVAGAQPGVRRVGRGGDRSLGLASRPGGARRTAGAGRARGLRSSVRGLLRLDGGGAVPGGHVASLLRPDRPAVHHRHPDRPDAAPDRPALRRTGAGRAADLPAYVAQRRGGGDPVDDCGVLRQQRPAQHPPGGTARVDARLAQSRGLREGRLLQPGARDLRPDLRRRTGRHRPLCPARGEHSRRRTSSSSAVRRSS